MKFSPMFLPHRHHQKYSPEITEHLKTYVQVVGTQVNEEYDHAYDYLSENYHNANNHKSIRNELCLFLNWTWQVQRKLVKDLTRKDIPKFIDFCNSPPFDLISSVAGVPITINEPKERLSEWTPCLNPNWKPFVNQKAKQGLAYQRLPATMHKQLSIISSFFLYLNDLEYTISNPAAIALRRLNPSNVANLGIEDNDRDKALSQMQVNCIFELLEYLVEENPEKYERSRFLFYLLVLAYPRRSEIAARPTHSPTFSDFRRHKAGDKTYYTFFIPRSKGSKSRSVIVSDMLLEALKRYRTFLGLNPLPLADEIDVPLFIRHQVATHGRQVGVLNSNLGAEQISALVQELFELAANVLIEKGEIEEASELRLHSCHSLRHVGISNDLYSGRPPSEVMKCSGHSSYSALEIYTSSRTDLRVPNVNLKDRIFDNSDFNCLKLD
ncbi:site-specific integrase [Moritella sp. F3]|uniref:tyrosine-type recombinase/integrase n=1 Tax=Moritella sp. F3 TaxID=2718882 RepID=UPI0018E0CE85|nr:site-specific integrase [Moritella sp. F3]GIC77712.1 integrase [Moritella sp. F1]GIC82125.1 integrase [Moritella sp. F3]